MKKPIENKIYASIILTCEEIENKGQYKGNGHHLAQRLTSLVAKGLLSKQQKKIYDALSTEKQRVGDIAKKVKLPSKQVSAVLGQIHGRTLLIHFTKDKKNKLWSKYDIQ